MKLTFRAWPFALLGAFVLFCMAQIAAPAPRLTGSFEERYSKALEYGGHFELQTGSLISQANSNLYSGTPTLNSAVRTPFGDRYGSALVEVVSSSGSGTLIFQCGDALGNWSHALATASITNIRTGSTGALSASASEWYLVTGIGGNAIGVTASAWSSGSVSVYIMPVSGGGGGSSSTTGGGGGAVTIADGADVALGTTTDTGVGNGTGSALAHLRYADTELALITAQLPTALDGSGFFKVHEQGTATVAGTVTANAGTNLNTSALALETGGNLAAIAGAVGSTGSAVPSKGAYQGGIATTAYPTAATAGNLVGAMYDKAGRQVTVSGAPRELVSSFDVNATDASSHTLVAAGAAGVKNDIVALWFTNTSTTGTLVTVSDGTANYHFYAPPTGTLGASLQVYMPETTAATAWTFQAGTGVSTLYVSGLAIANK